MPTYGSVNTELGIGSWGRSKTVEHVTAPTQAEFEPAALASEPLSTQTYFFRDMAGVEHLLPTPL